MSANLSSLYLRIGCRLPDPSEEKEATTIKPIICFCILHGLSDEKKWSGLLRSILSFAPWSWSWFTFLQFAFYIGTEDSLRAYYPRKICLTPKQRNFHMDSETTDRIQRTF